MGYCHRPQVHQGDRRETLSLADSEIPASPDGHPRPVLVQTVPVLLEPLQCPEIYTILRDMSCQSVGCTFNSFNTKIKVLKIANTTCPNLFEHVLNKLSQLI